ncbi:MAG: hypothetical protein OHK0029_05370 [Armatimonadaceae bacterium]
MHRERSENPAFAVMQANAAVQTGDGNGECWLWWEGDIPSLPNEKVGVIGNYRADSDEAGKQVLAEACEILAAQGCTLAVGPMSGNTWRSYRFVTESDPAEPPFFLEPTNPETYPTQWRDAGFSPLAEYYSTITTQLTDTDDRLERVRQRMRDVGVTFRALAVESPEAAEADLRAIYALSRTSFAQNFLYTPLPEEAFVAQYRPLLPMLCPELTLLAFVTDASAENLVGYLFALPDFAEMQRGEANRTVIIKTLAVLPGREWAGLGALLSEQCHHTAHDLGFTRAIHALMHQSNKSRNLSGIYDSRVIRRYTLYAKGLPQQ